MGLFERMPYTNFHDLNLTWILNELKTLEHTINEFVSINALKYADPIQWNIVTQYEKNTIVIDPLTGTAYISVQPVPSGVALTNTDYWTVVFDLGSFVVKAAKNFCSKYEEATTLTATFPSSVNDWLIWGDTLYYALVNITAGDSYVVDSNIKQFTVEDVVGHIQDLNTVDKSNLVAAINELVQALIDEATRVDGITGDLDNLTTTDKSNLVAAINEVLLTLQNTAGDLNNLTTTDKSNLVAAINELGLHITNLRIKNALDYGATGDGLTDDAAALQSWLDDLNTGDVGYLPAGDYIIRSPLTAPNIDGLTIIGTNSSRILVDFATGDAITFGGSPRKKNLFINNLSIDGAINHTSGAAIKIIGYSNYNKITNIKIGDYGSGYTTLYDGIVFEYTHVCYFDNFIINVNNKGMIVYGDPNGVNTNSSDLFVNHGSILHCSIGINLAGGFGGLYLNDLLVFGGKCGYRQNNTESALANREIFISSTVCFDGSDNQLIDIAETGNGSFININAFLSGAGYYADPGDQPYACNIRIASAPYATILMNNCINKASTQFGVYINEATARIIMTESCVIRDHVVGVNNVANSAYVYCHAIFINNSNTDFYGSYNPAMLPYPQPATPNTGDVRYNGGNIEHYNGSWIKLAGDCRVNTGNGQLSYWDGSTWKSMTSNNLAPYTGDVRYSGGVMQYWDGSAWTNV